MEATIIKAYTDDTTQIDALKAFMKALKIKFELTDDKPYNQDFVTMIKQGDEDLKAGKGRKVTVAELNSLWK